MSDNVLKGNYKVDGEPTVPSKEEVKETPTEEFERKARARIGGSIAFVTKTKTGEDVLLFDPDGEKDG